MQRCSQPTINYSERFKLSPTSAVTAEGTEVLWGAAVFMYCEMFVHVYTETCLELNIFRYNDVKP
jgi:hypothetical protein